MTVLAPSTHLQRRRQVWTLAATGPWTNFTPKATLMHALAIQKGFGPWRSNARGSIPPSPSKCCRGPEAIPTRSTQRRQKLTSSMSWRTLGGTMSWHRRRTRPTWTCTLQPRKRPRQTDYTKGRGPMPTHASAQLLHLHLQSYRPAQVLVSDQHGHVEKRRLRSTIL